MTDAANFFDIKNCPICDKGELDDGVKCGHNSGFFMLTSRYTSELRNAVMVEVYRPSATTFLMPDYACYLFSDTGDFESITFKKGLAPFHQQEIFITFKDITIEFIDNLVARLKKLQAFS